MIGTTEEAVVPIIVVATTAMDETTLSVTGPIVGVDVELTSKESHGLRCPPIRTLVGVTVGATGVEPLSRAAHAVHDAVSEVTSDVAQGSAVDIAFTTRGSVFGGSVVDHRLNPSG